MRSIIRGRPELHTMLPAGRELGRYSLQRRGNVTLAKVGIVCSNPIARSNCDKDSRGPPRLFRGGRRQEMPMDTIFDDARLPADIDAQPVVQAAAALYPELRGYREEIERGQRFPKEL